MALQVPYFTGWGYSGGATDQGFFYINFQIRGYMGWYLCFLGLSNIHFISGSAGDVTGQVDLLQLSEGTLALHLQLDRMSGRLGPLINWRGLAVLDTKNCNLSLYLHLSHEDATQRQYLLRLRGTPY